MRPQPNQSDWRQEAGPLRKLLMDQSISEIMVNRFDRIFIERNGLLEEVDLKFESVDALTRFVQSLAVVVGKELNRRTPFLDARLPDGSRLNAVVPPIAMDGPTVTIRKFTYANLNYQQLISKGTLDDKSLYFLSQAVVARQNMIISGGTGTGKTTLLNTISSFISPKERVVTIEDTAELQLNSKNLVRMESKISLGTDESFTMRDLLKNALRMRPDRIVIGECRGSEAWDMLMAMNTGHEGSLTTLHANSAYDALRRLEAMVLRSESQMPLPVLQKDIARTVNIIIQAERGSDGQRRVVEIAEVLSSPEEVYLTQSIFSYEPGQGLISTGYTPSFIKNNKNPKIKIVDNFFDPQFKIKIEGLSKAS